MTEVTRVSVGDPGALISTLPLLLGYRPDPGDMVVTGLSDRGRVVVTMRFVGADLPGVEEQQIGQILGNIQEGGVRSLILTGYGTGQQVTPNMDRLRALVGPVMPVNDALRVEGDRYFSYTCLEPDCCPPEGRQFEADSDATTALRVAGLTAEASRDRIADRFAAPTGEDAVAAKVAWSEALLNLPTIPEGRALVDDVIKDCREGKPLATSQAGRLAAAMTQLPIRDHAWSLMAREHATAHTGLWADVLRHVPVEASPAPASLLAWCSWQRGDGATGHVAAERALQADPDYSMASLIEQALSAGLHPSMATPPMTPEETARSYEADYDDLEMEAS